MSNVEGDAGHFEEFPGVADVEGNQDDREGRKQLVAEREIVVLEVDAFCVSDLCINYVSNFESLCYLEATTTT